MTPNSSETRTFQTRTATLRMVRWVTGGALAVLAGCGVTDAASRPTAAMVLDLAIPGGRTGSLVIPDSAVLTVTGVGISTPITGTFLFDTSGVARATMQIPIGANRVLQVDMYKGGSLVFSGTSTFNVSAGVNAPQTLTPVATTGIVPIVVTIGSFVVSVTPTSATVVVSATRSFSATVRDPTGAIATGITAKWAVANPAFVTVDSLTGLVTAVHSGTTTITATALGTAAVATVVVP